MKPVRVVIADDHLLVLEAFRNLLSHKVEVVGTASNGHELTKVARQTEPDVIVTGISMPELNGLDASIQLLKLLSNLKCIFLTMSDDPDVVARVMRSGAKGYLLKRSATSELLQASARWQDFLRCVQTAMPALPTLVPGPRLNLTWFHGIFAPNFKHRHRIVPRRPRGRVDDDKPLAPMNWGPKAQTGSAGWRWVRFSRSERNALSQTISAGDRH